MRKLLPVTFLFTLALAAVLTAQQATVTVGIMPFVNEKGKKLPDDAAAAELASVMARYRFIRLVERSRLDEIVKEMELGMTGLVDEKSAVRTGKIRGLEIMIFGTVSLSGVTARAVHTETGRIIASGSAARHGDMKSLGEKLAFDMETYLARENVKRLRNDSPGITVDFWMEKKNGARMLPGKGNTMKIGESIVFRFKSNRDGYLTIVDIQPGGDVVVLYPNEFSRDNRITAGTLYSIPGSGDTFEITVSEPAGNDTVVAFFTEKKAEWLDASKLEGSGFRTVKGAERFMATRGISITATGLNKAQWESAVIDINVVK